MMGGRVYGNMHPLYIYSYTIGVATQLSGRKKECVSFRCWHCIAGYVLSRVIHRILIVCHLGDFC